MPICHAEETNDGAWSAAPLREVIDHIVAKHHPHLRGELATLEKLAAAIGQNLPGGGEVAKLVESLNRDLELQMQKEETILFPAILQLESASREGRHPGHSKFGSVRNLAKVIGRSNSQTVKALEELRQLTNGYVEQPKEEDAISCLFRRLARLDTNLHRHIHIENEILFRRAAELEGEVQ
jgi:regulator of cell morphogenesis and NO signaling